MDLPAHSPIRVRIQGSLAALWDIAPLLFALTYILVRWLAPLLLRQSPIQDPREVFIGGETLQAVRPERLEELRYLLLLTAPCLLLLASWRMPRLASIVRFRTATSAVFTLAIFALWVSQRDIHIYYYDEWLLPFATLGVLLCYCIAWIRKLTARRGWLGPRTTPWFQRAADVLFIALLVARLLPSIVTGTSLAGEFHGVRYHFPYTIGEFAAALGGKTPWVSYQPQYQNLLGLLLEPWFRLFSLTALSFSLTLTLLSALGLGAVYLGLRRIVTAPLARSYAAISILGLSFFALVFDPFHTLNFSNYYALSPLRYFGPFLVFGALAWAVAPARGYSPRRAPARPAATALLATLATLVAANNFDFGIPSYLAAGSSLLIVRGRFARHLTAWFAGTLAALLALIAAISLRSGHLPNLSEAFLFQKMFGLYGFFMLPAPEWGIQWLLYLTEISCVLIPLQLCRFGKGAASGLHGRVDALYALMAYSGIFGCGAGMYYVGRSHPYVLAALFPIWAISLLLLLIHFWGVSGRIPYRLLDSLARPSAAPAASPERSVFARLGNVRATLIFLLLLAPAMCLREPLQVVRKLAGPPSTSVSLETHIAARADFVRKNSLPSDRIMVLGAYGPWIALTARRTDVFPYTEHRSIILKEQVERIRRVVLDQNVTHVFGVLPDELKVALENMGFRRLDTFTDGGEEFVSDSSDAFRVEHWARN